MKLNNYHKGKVHPSPSSSPLLSPSPTTTTTTTTTTKDSSAALKLLPAAILALISVLSLEDQEVLAYMITRSLEATANPSHFLLDNKHRRRRRTKQASASSASSAATTPHTPPVFHCGCFDCYTSYWFRWDSSLNRELIHQAIEAFEDHLTSGESPSEQSRKRGRGKKKSDKKLVPVYSETEDSGASSPIPADELPDSVDFAVEEVLVKVEDGVDEVGIQNEELVEVASPPEAAVDVEEETTETGTAVTGGGHKGLARKVLPDVIGLFSSRFWSLWSPNA